MISSSHWGLVAPIIASVIHDSSTFSTKYEILNGNHNISSLLETITVPANLKLQSSERALNPSLVKNYATTCTTLYFVFPTNERIVEQVGFD